MKKLALIIGFAGIIASCGESKFPGFEKTETGLYYQILSEGEGKEVAMEDILTLDLKYSTSRDSVLYNSENVSYPTQLKVSPLAYDGDIMEGIMMLKEGGQAIFKTKADSFFAKLANMETPAFVDSGSYLTFEIRVNKVQSAEELRAEKEAANAVQMEAEMGLIQSYLQENNITESPTESGLIYVERSKGTGKAAERGSKVKVHYMGRLLTGEKFDASYDRGEPFEFTLGMGRVIPGWDEGIGYMKAGGKATLIIPSNLAYGENPPPGGVIKPFSPLVFEVELLEVN